MTAAPARPAGRPGFSLLEVLVACGILVIGLASVAALLPAATARLREAATQDRAGSMAAAALAEFECRDLAFRNLFLETSTTYLPANRAVVFGQVLPNVPGAVVTTGTTIVTLSAAASTELGRRIDTAAGDANRGFFLEDELQYTVGGGPAPLNSFVQGVREFRRGVCWGAMVEPFRWGTIPSGTVAPQMRAVRATIAVFRKPGAVQRIMVSGSAGGLFRVTSSPFDDSLRKRFLAPCSPVLAVAQSGTDAPCWLTINSSWPQWNSGIDPQSMPPSSFGVVFREPGSAYSQLIGSGSSMQLIGFENIQSITQQTFTID